MGYYMSQMEVASSIPAPPPMREIAVAIRNIKMNPDLDVTATLTPSPPPIPLPPASADPDSKKETLRQQLKMQELEYEMLKRLVKTMIAISRFEPFILDPAMRKPGPKSRTFAPKIHLEAYNKDFLNEHMSLRIIEAKQSQGQYSDPWGLLNDLHRIVQNIMAHNSKATHICKLSLEFSRYFENEVDRAMRDLNYCCGQRQIISPQKLICMGKDLCMINTGEPYFSFEGTYLYCDRCFEAQPPDEVPLPLPGLPDTKVTVPKTRFVKLTNDKEELEPFVTCSMCGRKSHDVCVFYYKEAMPNGFCCDACYFKNTDLRNLRNYNAKILPSSKLSDSIELKLNRFLYDSGVRNPQITVRVIATFDRTVQVKPGMRRMYVDTEKMCCDNFPYKCKIIFVFQNIDGVDVCIFAFIVQEYGSDCPPPNSRLVYLSYLDSVRFFKPDKLRTPFFHEILLSYFEYVKTLGFLRIHIWSCPPTDGDDYIFHRHPPHQKIPTLKMLCEWYRKLLQKGVERKVLVGFKSFKEHVGEENLTLAYQFPYFEGDFWPGKIEEIIIEFEKQSEPNADDPNSPGMPRKRKRSGPNSSIHLTESGPDDFIWKKACQEITKHKDVFFVVQLWDYGSIPIGEIIDPDPGILIPGPLLDTRDGLLSLARDHRLEFTTLRRAKYLTFVILFHLHRKNEGDRVYRCNKCGEDITHYVRYQCDNCTKTYCSQCYGERKPSGCLACGNRCKTIGYEEPVIESIENCKTKLERSAATLFHSTDCANPNCSDGCIEMKKHLRHIKICGFEGTRYDCEDCSATMEAIFYHAKKCNEEVCHVYFCENAKQMI